MSESALFSVDELTAVASNARFDGLSRFSRLQSPQFTLHKITSSERVQVEHYIQDKFFHVHNAKVSHFLPDIITLSCHDGYSAAVGLCAADRGALFAEKYLVAPVETVLQDTLGIATQRDKIVEIGNLVSTWKGSSMLLFVFLSELIDRLGFHWAMFTATHEVEQLLARLHYVPVILADAQPQCLEDDGVSWGTYYRTRPRVMIGDVRAALAQSRDNKLYRTTAAVIKSRVDQVVDQYQSTGKILMA